MSEDGEQTNVVVDVDDNVIGNNFETLAIHAGQDSTQWASRAVVPPLVLSTTFQQYSPSVTAGWAYGRSANPTRDSLQTALAALENAKYSLVFASGLAATMNITQLFQAGDHFLLGDELYGGTTRYFRTVASRFGIEFDCIDFDNVQQVVKSIKSNTKMIWFETPTNPRLKVTDIQAVCSAVKQVNQNIVIVVDNTFMSPYFQKPLNFGADLSMSSITKYINGHSDVIMGCVSTNSADLYDRLKYLQKAVGAVSSPFDCFLVNRGIKTLALRMERHQENALQVAQFLECHALVKKVFYIGLPSHPQYEITKKQCTGFSGMVGFSIRGTLENVKRCLENVKIFRLAESLGGVESLIGVPSLMTHASLPAELRAQLGLDDTYIRISVGVENVHDLIEDLDQALEKAK